MKNIWTIWNIIRKKLNAEYWADFSDECLASFEALAQTAEKGTTVPMSTPKYCFVQPIVKKLYDGNAANKLKCQILALEVAKLKLEIELVKKGGW